MMKKRIQAGVIASLVAISLLVGPRVAQAAAPTDAQISLINPVLTAANTSEAAVNQRLANGWVGNGWFGEGLIFQRAFAPVGSLINLTYHVTDKNGKPLINQDVNLRINKGHSTSTSIVQVDGVKTKGVDRPPLDQANVIHKTDAFGNVTWAVQNLDAAPMGEPQPASWTSKPDITEDGLNDLHSQMLPQVAGEKPDHSVLSEFHYYIPNSPTVATAANIKLVAPVLDATNSFASGSGAYAQAGSKVVFAYLVTDAAGNAAPGIQVKLTLNKSAGSAKVSALSLSATSDAFGFATFTVKNSDTKGEANPASATAATPTTGAVFAEIAPEVAGISTVPVTSIHFYGTPVSADSATSGLKVSAMASGKSVVVTITGASGKSATISINGKSSKVNVAISNQSFSFPTTSGLKKIVVTIAGKSYTASTTVK